MATPMDTQPPPSPTRAFWWEVRKGFTGGLFWGGIHGAIVGGVNAQVSWMLGLNFALLILAVWFPITTTVGVVRGIKAVRNYRAKPGAAPDPAS